MLRLSFLILVRNEISDIKCRLSFTVNSQQLQQHCTVACNAVLVVPDLRLSWLRGTAIIWIGTSGRTGVNEIPQEKRIPDHGITMSAIGYSLRRLKIWRTEVCIFFSLSQYALLQRAPNFEHNVTSRIIDGYLAQQTSERISKHKVWNFNKSNRNNCV